MFTGIVEALGSVRAIDPVVDAARLHVDAGALVDGMQLGDSLCVNGVCLTASAIDGTVVTADVMAQTLRLTALGALNAGDAVNLERALRADGRLGGHHVQGHVDATATVLARTPSEHWEVVTIALPAALARYVVAQGSIAVDGVSLTVAQVRDDSFDVSCIPETLRRTTLGTRTVGALVNLEVDVLAKYVERLLAGHLPQQQGGSA